MSELRGRCRHCDGYYCDNVGGCPVGEVVAAQPTAPVLNCFGGTAKIPPKWPMSKWSMSIEQLFEREMAADNLRYAQQAGSYYYTTYPMHLGTFKIGGK